MLHNSNNGDFPVKTNDFVANTYSSKWQLRRAVHDNAVVRSNVKRSWIIWNYLSALFPGADPGGGAGGPGPPLSENLGIDFYSGFRKKSRYTLL